MSTSNSNYGVTTLSEVQRDLQMHHFHLHNYVTHQELTCHIRLPGDLPLSEGHAIATRIEQMIEQEYKISATIHVEPIGYEHPED